VTTEAVYRLQRRRARLIRHIGWALVFVGLVVGVVGELRVFFDTGRVEYDVAGLGHPPIPAGHGGPPLSPWPAIGLGGGIAVIGVLLIVLARLRRLRFPGRLLIYPDNTRE
jgi:hypothetical protein